MTNLFLYGTLCHAPLLTVVLGHAPKAEAAELADHGLYWAGNRSYPVLLAEPAAKAPGLLLRDLSAEDLARVVFYQSGLGEKPGEVQVQAADGPVKAMTFLPAKAATPGPLWRLADWQAIWADTVTATAGDVMALYGQRPPEVVKSRYSQMLVRGASRVRAQSTVPTELRRHAEPGDVEVVGQRAPYLDFFALEEYDLRHRRFDGRMSSVINRTTFVACDACTVLPYDPVRDRVLLIEQFRVGPYARGDMQCWQLEAIAGRVDADETPEQSARREAMEEAGVVVGEMLRVAQYYPSNGAKTEYLYSFVGLTDLPDGVAGVFGLEAEAEDIRGHLLSFDRLMELVASGEADNAPLLLSAMWLDRERPRLRAAALARLQPSD